MPLKILLTDLYVVYQVTKSCVVTMSTTQCAGLSGNEWYMYCEDIFMTFELQGCP